ncbi:MAG: LTA synthase family protein [Lachnospiraceae bacterium]|nr:LTA synthase family protein [Lachnospiraceae bacterium]
MGSTEIDSNNSINNSDSIDNRDSIEEFIDAEISSIKTTDATEDKLNDDKIDSDDKIESVEEKKSFFSSLPSVPVRVAIFLALIVYEELMFHFLSIGNDASYLPVKLVMCVPTAIVLSLVTMFLPKTAAKIVEAVMFGALLFYYGLNQMYYSAFKVFFSVKLIDSSNARITQYYREILNNIKQNGWQLALIVLLPIVVYVLLRVFKRITYKRVHIKLCFVPLVALVLFIAAEVGVAYSYGNDTFSPYNLMTGENISDFSFPRLGVLASAEIEIKNIILPTQIEEEEEYEVWHYDPSVMTANVSNTTGTDGDANDSSNVGNTSGAGSGNNDTQAGDVSQQGNDTPVEQERIIDTSPNMLDIDFVALGESETNSEVAGIHKYFASVEPSYKNEYTGMFEGYNLIFLTCEAFCPLAVDEELTPTLYKLVNEGFVFNNFYNSRTGGSTSDGEFVNSTALVPTNGGATNFRIVGQHSMPFALGNMFNMTYGITSRAYHDGDFTYYDRDKTYPGMGYLYTGIGNGLNISWSWPESDLEMMEATIPDYIDDELFHVYYMTVSGHMNYNFGGNAMSAKHRAEVEDLPYSTACKAYIACQMELDVALEYLLAQLEEKGIADRTVICFTGDHWPYGLTNEEYSELLGHEVEPNFELFKSNLVLWSGSIEEPIVIDKYCSSMDILPTLLNLFGFDYDSRLLMGRDILSDTEDFVIFINRSFITDKVMYNSQNGQVTYLTDEELPEDYISNCKTLLNNRWKYSQKIMDTDYYKYICTALEIEIPKVEQNY